MQPIVYIVVAIIGWACWAVFNKLALNSLPPTAVAFVASAMNIALGFVYWFATPKDCKWNTIGIVWAVVAALFTFGGSYAYMCAASQKEVSSVISLTAIYPALTFLIAVVFLGETFTISKLGGLALILAGVWVINK